MFRDQCTEPEESTVADAAVDSRHKKRSRMTPNITRLQLKAQVQVMRLNLEAVFHPKFENEKSDTQIRQQMLTSITERRGYLEVSLKHSGSLLLWSGRQRFYSKNSTSNIFTNVGEILLMQHFARCYGLEKWQSEYERCSEYLHQNRLTCSFELVTSILGQHGDVPKRDYLILIAVADRGNGGRFYSINELVTFAQQFNLPHNDVWVFASRRSAEQVFTAYSSLREEGTTSTVINALDRITTENHGHTAKVPSLYPHDIFQGEILEGIVIRYVNYTDGGAMKEMEQLRIVATNLLDIVPPSKQVDVQTLQSDGNEDEKVAIVQTDLRVLAVRDNFEQQLHNLLHKFHGANRRHISPMQGRIDGNRVEDQEETNITHIANEIKRSNDSGSAKFDQETILLAELIQALDSLNIHATYRLFKESMNGNDGRCLCILHIHNDSSFQKYSQFLKQQKGGGMELFRGFCIELIANESEDRNSSPRECNHCPDTAQFHHEEKLMLKMKFLPYMVRTFICRNGLSTLQNSGVVAFENFAVGQMKRWDVSDSSMKKWLPFFKAWSIYCTSSLPKHLPPLSSNAYIQHYNECEKRYASGHFSGSPAEECLCQGLVVLVAMSKNLLQSLGIAISQELKCQRIVHNMSEISERDVLLSMHQKGNGMICLASIEEDLGYIRKLSKSSSDAINIVHVGNRDEDLESSFVDIGIIDIKQMRKIKGMAQAWRKTKCNAMLQLPKEASLQTDIDATICFLRSNEHARSVIEALATKKEIDARPGLIIYFPSIPGSGKSSLCSDIGVTKHESCHDRSFMKREGDAIKGKFYNEVEKDMLTKPGCITILDKNVPPVSFSSVHTLCSVCNCFSVAVLPSGMKDTVVGNDIYPFSLQFLAACINRVLRRKQHSHLGKLDSATEHCCMIVVRFYSFYRNISVSVMRERLLNVGTALEPIEVPFFPQTQKELPDVPEEVKVALERAINALARDIKRTDVDDEESAIRLAIGNHHAYFDNLTEQLEQTKNVFNTKLSHLVSSLPGKIEATVQLSQTIKIASLDFDYDIFCSVLEKVKARFDQVKEYFDEREDHKSNDENDTTQNRFIKSVHCTFAHFSQVTQSEMMTLFNHLLGINVEAKATALLYSDKIAAIQVEVPEEATSDRVQHRIPMPRNEFPHVTIWCGQDVEAKESNELPTLVENSIAKKIVFDDAIPLIGSFSFWYEQINV